MGDMIDKVTDPSTAGTYHFSRVWLEAFRPLSANESLRCGKETGQEGKVAEHRDLGICSHGGFTKNGKTVECIGSV